MSGRIYLDHNASAPVHPMVREAIADALALCGNASSVHAEGRQLRALIEGAREKVAALVGARPRDVIFTSGGTEANVTALSPVNVSRAAPERVVCFICGIEHPSVLSGGRFAADAVRRIPATGDGVIDIAALEREIAAHIEVAGEGTFMVSLMLANNETGAVQPVAQVAEIVAEHGGILHCDAIQAAGKVPVDIGRLGAHILSISAHKIGGPQGVGALVLGNGWVDLPSPLLTGGGQEFRARSGTENAGGIAGFGVAAEAAMNGLDQVAERAKLRDRMEAEITVRAPGAAIFAKNAPRLPNTSNFAVPGLRAETIVIALDLAGVAVSAGSSCSSGKVEQSHVLEAMGVEADLARGAIRVSLGRDTTDQDIEAFLAAWGEVHDQFAAKRAAA